MSISDGIADYGSIGGMRAIFALIQGRLLGTAPETAVNVPGIKHPVRLRVRTSDADVFHQVFTNREYEFPFFGVPKVIMDAGANVGLTSVFYANKYPQAKILAVEPAASNFRMLAQNTAPYGNIIPIRAALWCACGHVGISGLEFQHAGFRVLESCETSSETVPAVTVETVMSQYGIEFIDILKLDIEGAEKEVLEGSSAWIDKVGAIALETHDRFKPGCTQALEQVIAPFSFRLTNGEIEYYARHAPI